MDQKLLYKQAAARARALDLPSPFDAFAFCRAVERSSGRPIVLRAVRMDGGVYGAWLPVGGTDFIFYEEDTSAFHQQQIILHEGSHIVCAHRPTAIPDAELVQLLAPLLRLDMGTVGAHMRLRHTYSAREEQEAEVLASLLLERVAAAPVLSGWELDPEAAALIDRLRASLEATPGGTE